MFSKVYFRIKRKNNSMKNSSSQRVVCTRYMEKSRSQRKEVAEKLARGDQLRQSKEREEEQTRCERVG